MLAIFLLFGAFFSLYYFYYVPAQRNSLHQYAFSLLERIQTNILARNRDLGQLYRNTVVKHVQDKDREALDVMLGRLSAPAFMMLDTTGFLRDKPPAPGAAATSLTDTTVHFAWLDGWRLVYPIADAGRKTVPVSIPVAELLEPCFVYRKEFFESYLLVRMDKSAGTGIVVYGADSFGMRQEMSGDSLLLRQKGGGFPQTTDITLKGVPYKLFSWSFLLDRQPVVLCGVVKQSVYHSTIHTIPLKVVYPVIILLLLTLLALPFLKLYFMGRREPLRNRDFTFGAIAVAIGVAMITLIIIHVLLLFRSDREISSNLKRLSKQIEGSVSQELAQAGHQLTFFDQELSLRVGKEKDSLPGLKVKHTNGKDSIFIPWMDSASGTSYYYFNRLSWVDSTGKQQWKAQIDDPETIKFIDVSNRHYYRVFKDTMPGSADTGLMVMEPVNSWTSGDFEINLSQRSKVTGRAAVMSTHLYSLQNTILPPGFGYCLMDNAGHVYTHSDIRKGLKENFLDETGRLRAVQEAIASHQDTVLNNIMLYSKPHSIYIHPLQKPPLFLVTFYDKSFFFAVHLRILVFALLLLTICATLVILAMVLLYWKPNRHAAFAPADYAQWMLPKRTLLPYYKSGSLFMALYQLLILLSLNEHDAYLLLLVTCLTPLNVLSALAAFRLYEDTYLLGKQDLRWSRVLTLVLLQGAFTLLAGICGEVSWREGWRFYGFQGTLFIALLWVVYYDRLIRTDNSLLRWWHQRKEAAQQSRFGGWYSRFVNWQWWKRKQWHYLTWHAIFILLLTQCLSSLPAALFTWYAQNHEIRQSVKKGQLYLATQLEQRKSGIERFLKDHDTTVARNQYADTIAYTKGIYTIHDDRVMRPAVHATWHVHQAAPLYTRSEDFYLEVVNRVIPNYNDPLFYPALRNSSSDERWHWDSCCRDTMELTWHPAREGLFARNTAVHTAPLLIVSDLPDRYVMTKRWLMIVLLLALGILIAIGLVSLIRMTIYRFFSLRFVHWQEGGSEPGIPGEPVIQPGHFLDKCYETTRNREAIDLQGTACLAAYFKQTSTTSETITLATAEEQEALIMKQVNDCRLFFEAIWAACSEEDKLLLMNLAQYGVLNYKNTEGIYRLISHELVTVYNGRLALMSPAFRYYILTRIDQPEEVEMKRKTMAGGRWQQIRMPLLVIFLLIGIFLFITQEEAFKKVGAILTSVTGLISLLVKFGGDVAAAKK